MKNGDLLFCFRDTTLSEAIQAGTQSQFSHVAGVRIEHGVVMIYDAQIDGFEGKTFKEWQERYGYTYVIMRNPFLTNEIWNEQNARLNEIIGKPYDFMSLIVRKPFNIGRQIANVFRRKDKPMWNQVKPLKAVFCSEAWAYIIGLKNIDVSPGQLFTEVTLLNYKRVVE